MKGKVPQKEPRIVFPGPKKGRGKGGPWTRGGCGLHLILKREIVKESANAKKKTVLIGRGEATSREEGQLLRGGKNLTEVMRS